MATELDGGGIRVGSRLKASECTPEKGDVLGGRTGVINQKYQRPSCDGPVFGEVLGVAGIFRVRRALHREGTRAIDRGGAGTAGQVAAEFPGQIADRIAHA